MMISDGWATPISDGPALLEFLDRLTGQEQTPKKSGPEDPPAQSSLAF